MFHTYVLNARGKPISLERAEWLMDSRIVRLVLNDGLSFEKSPQDFFDRYCRYHQEKHGADFPPAIAETF